MTLQITVRAKPFCRHRSAWQVLSSVSPGLEIHATIVGTLRNIFARGRDDGTDGGFLRTMRSLTGAHTYRSADLSCRES